MNSTPDVQPLVEPMEGWLFVDHETIRRRSPPRANPPMSVMLVRGPEEVAAAVAALVGRDAGNALFPFILVRSTARGAFIGAWLRAKGAPATEADGAESEEHNDIDARVRDFGGRIGDFGWHVLLDEGEAVGDGKPVYITPEGIRLRPESDYLAEHREVERLRAVLRERPAPEGAAPPPELAPKAAPRPTKPRTTERERLVKRVVKFVGDYQDAHGDRGPSQSAILRKVGGKAENVRQLLRELSAPGEDQSLHATPAPRGGTEYRTKED